MDNKNPYVDNNALEALEYLVLPYMDQDWQAANFCKLLIDNIELINLAAVIADYNKRNN